MGYNWLHLYIMHGSIFELFKLRLVPRGTVTPDVRQPCVAATEVIAVLHRRYKQPMHATEQVLVLSTAIQFHTPSQNKAIVDNRLCSQRATYYKYLLVCVAIVAQSNCHSRISTVQLSQRNKTTSKQSLLFES